MPFQLPRVTVSPRTAKLLWLLAFTVAACYLLHIINRLPRVNLSETLTILPQGMYLMRALRHQDIALSMPMSPFLATLFAGLPQWIELVIWPLFLILACMLAMAAGRRLASAPGGMAALLLAAFAFGSSKFWTPGSMSYCLACGIVTLALAMRAGKPRTWGSELLTALAIGFSYTLKSPLFLLPPLLAAYDIFTGKLREGKTSAGKLAILAFGPYALLLPWTYMNWKVFHVFRLFEGGRADENIITGALGIVYTVEGAYSLADTAGQNIVWWAFKTVLSHPLVYIEGVLKRLYGLFVWYPAASTLFLLGMGRLRKLPQARTLGLFVSYIVGIMCLMSIQKAYFAPIWIPALAIAAAGLMPAKPRSDESTLMQRATLLVFIAIGTALYLPLSAYLIAYPNRLQPPSVAFSADAPDPDDNPVLLVRMSETALSSGNIAQAYIYSAAALRRTNSPLTASAFLTALSARGIDIATPLRNRAMVSRDVHSTLRTHRLFFLNALIQNRMTEAATILPQLKDEWEKYNLTFSGITSAREAALYSKQQRESTLFNNVYIPGLLEKYPRELRSELAVKVLKLGIDSPRLQVMRLEHDLNTGGEEATPEQIEQMLKAAKTEESLARLLDLCQRHGLRHYSISYAKAFLKIHDSSRIRLYLLDALLREHDFIGAQQIIDKLRDSPQTKNNQLWLSDLEHLRDAQVIQAAVDVRKQDKAYAMSLAQSLRVMELSSLTRLRVADELTFGGYYKIASEFVAGINPAKLPENEMVPYRNLITRTIQAELLALRSSGQTALMQKRAEQAVATYPYPDVIISIAGALVSAKEFETSQYLADAAHTMHIGKAEAARLSELENMRDDALLQMAKSLETADAKTRQAFDAKPMLAAKTAPAVSLRLAAALASAGQYKPADRLLSRINAANLPESELDNYYLLKDSTLKYELLKLYSARNFAQLETRAEEILRESPGGNTGVALYLATAQLAGKNLSSAAKTLEELKRRRLTGTQAQWLSALQNSLDAARSGKYTNLPTILPGDLDTRDLNTLEQNALYLIHTRTNRSEGLLQMAQLKITEASPAQAQEYLEQALKEKLSDGQRKWARSMLLKIQELQYAGKTQKLDQAIKLLERNAYNPRALLPIAREFTSNFPHYAAGHLYLASALIGTGKYDEAGKKLSEISG
ncbi:MAG: hypothetical protein GX410_04280, partial [Elusimicrobia bacterium]|nr:hypothetical protein [Elusimicrobiota bacterium]